MRNIILLYIALIIASATGCSRHSAADSTLDRADSLMESRPDSALTLLRAIDSSSLSRRATCARYALLMSQALDKNYIDVTSDSLISIATAYYADRPDSPELMKSLFYRARTYYNDSRFDRATIDATHAYEIAVKLDDPFWIGKTADLLADIFNETYNYEEAIRFRKIAVKSYAEAKKILFNEWALSCLAIDYLNNEKFDSALLVTDSLMRISKCINKDSALMSSCMSTIFNCYFGKEEYDSAKIYFNKYQQYNHQLAPLNLYCDIAITETFLGNLDTAKTYIDSAYILYDSTNTQHVIAINLATLEYARKTKNHIKDAELTKKLLNLQNEIVKETIRQSAIGAQRDYYNSQSTAAAKRESQMWTYIIFGCIIVFMAISILTIFFRMSIKLKDNTIELKINEVALLSAQIDRRENECHKLKEKLANLNENSRDHVKMSTREAELRQLVDRLLAGRFSSINKILDEYYENIDSSSAKTKVYNRVQKEMDDLSSTKSMNEIEKLVNDALDSIMTRFRNEFPDATKEDITIFLLNAAGLSQKAISLLTGIKLKSLYTKRARLKERILKSDVSGCHEYIARLS